MVNEIERAVSAYSGDFNCSQALITAYAPRFSLSVETAMKLGAPFGGGMGRLGEVCGAVTGAFMVIGLMAGDAKADVGEIKSESTRLVNEFVRRFKARNGTIICRELLGYDISTSEGLEAVKDRNLSATHCSRFVRDAAEIISELLES